MKTKNKRRTFYLKPVNGCKSHVCLVFHTAFFEGEGEGGGTN